MRKERIGVRATATLGAMGFKGPTALLVAWAIHDIEEALAFPATCDALADETGIERFRLDQRQSWLAVGFMGTIVSFACHRGARTKGRSKLYRAVSAGLEAHVATHLLASFVQRRYTAGVATALPVMWPGAAFARRDIERTGPPLGYGDYIAGAAILIPAALACQVLARLIPRRGGSPLPS